MKFICSLINFVMLSTGLIGQITFENLYPFTSAYSIRELPGGGYIACASDSSDEGCIFTLDRFGVLGTTTCLNLRGEKVRMNDIQLDIQTGGVAVCGWSPDPNFTDETGYFLLLDNQMNKTDSIFYGGSIDGPEALNLVSTSNNDFIVSTEVFTGGGSSSSDAHKIIHPSLSSWSAHGGSDHGFNAIALDKQNKLLFATYNSTSLSGSGFSLFDTSGVYIDYYGILDTAYGGSLIHKSLVTVGADGSYYFIVYIEPFSLSYNVAYLAKLDTAMNLLWDKYIDWGYSISIDAITGTSDSCLMLLLGTPNGLTFHKISTTGDSLWTQFHNRTITGGGRRLIETSDHGFMIIGDYYNGSVSTAYILKTDSLARLLPPAIITVSGPIEFCPGDSVMLSVPAGYDYFWSTTDTTNSIWVSQSGNYSLAVTDSFGNTAYSDTINVSHFNVQVPIITSSGNLLSASGAGSFQWYFNNFLIPGAADPDYTATQSGSYFVELTDSNGCLTVSQPFLHSLVNIKETEDLVIYQETVQAIVLHFNEMIKQIKIMDSQGREIYSANNLVGPLVYEKTNLAHGIYFIQLLTGKGKSWNRAFVK